MELNSFTLDETGLTKLEELTRKHITADDFSEYVRCDPERRAAVEYSLAALRGEYGPEAYAQAIERTKKLKQIAQKAIEGLLNSQSPLASVVLREWLAREERKKETDGAS
jgi:hypothetical protein